MLHPPGGPTAADRLVRGAIDLHHHGYPEISFDALVRYEDVDELALARDAGMLGVVLKSHMFPTVGRAYHLRAQVPGIEVFPSITLNHAVGGLNPLAMGSAALQGARAVFMPTWSAAHDIERGGMSAHLRHFLPRAESTLRPGTGIRLTGVDGRLTQETREVLDCARQYGLMVSTGHISPAESLALAEGAKDHGIDEVVFSHPDSGSVGARREEVRDMAALGAVVEFCALGLLPPYQRIRAQEIVDVLAEVGADKAVLTTDYFFEWMPSGPETLRMLAGALLGLGVSEDDLRRLVRENPARLLGLTPSAVAVLDRAHDEVRVGLSDG